MKIKEIVNAPPPLSTAKQSRKDGARQLDFGKLLDSAREAMVRQPGVAPPEGRNMEVQTLPHVEALGRSEYHEIQSQSVAVTQETLGMLEDYQKALANPEVSLKQINPMVQSLALEVKRLNSLAEKIPPSDRLHGIMRDLGIVTAVEIERFNRGEYV